MKYGTKTIKRAIHKQKDSKTTENVKQNRETVFLPVIKGVTDRIRRKFREQDI